MSAGWSRRPIDQAPMSFAPRPFAGIQPANRCAEVNLWLFQTPKSDPSTRPSALKSPADQAAVAVNLGHKGHKGSDLNGTTPCIARTCGDSREGRAVGMIDGCVRARWEARNRVSVSAAAHRHTLRLA